MKTFRVRIVAEYEEDVEADTPAAAEALAWEQIDWRNPKAVSAEDVYCIKEHEDNKAA